MGTDLAPPRGTQDLLPDRSDAMLGLYEAAHELARLFGFRYVETPTFEDTEVFARTSGDTSDVVTKEMYTFEDKGGRSVTLRPESTAGVVRAWLDRAQALGAPWRAYAVANEFRHGRPQAGRLREFRQFDVEVLGVEAPGADVEVITMGDRYLRERGLRDVVLHLNSIGDEVCRPAYRAELVAYFEPFRDQLDRDCRERLEKNPLRVFDCKVDGEKDFVLAAPTIADRLCEPCAEHFAAVRAGLDEAGVPYELDPRLVRGLDYYTRTAFEWISGVLAENKAGTINAGGRYDGLAEQLGGQPTPGVGFAMGLDRVLLAMEGEGVAVPAARTPALFRGGDRGPVADGGSAPGGDPAGRRGAGGAGVRGTSVEGPAEAGRPLGRRVRRDHRGARARRGGRDPATPRGRHPEDGPRRRGVPMAHATRRLDRMR